MEYPEFMRRANAQLASVWVKFNINGSDLLGTLNESKIDDTNGVNPRWVNIDVPNDGRYTVDVLEQVTHVGPRGNNGVCTIEDAT